MAFIKVSSSATTPMQYLAMAVQHADSIRVGAANKANRAFQMVAATASSLAAKPATMAIC
jgi:hypothetical protein